MKVICIKCGKKFAEKEVCSVDGKDICAKCMYGDMEPVVVYPIGVVRNSQERLKAQVWTEEQGQNFKDRAARIPETLYVQTGR